MSTYVRAMMAGVVVLAMAAVWTHAAPAAGQAQSISLSVAADGNDANPGTMEAPFATLERARDEVRRLKNGGVLARPVTVNVRAGTYFFDRTFRLSAEDSGTADAPVVYRGYGGERPRLIGGKPARGFAPYRDQILVADLVDQGLKGAAFRQLFFDGRRQNLARYPNFDPQEPIAGGWAYVEGTIVNLYRDQPDDSKHLLHFKPQDARTWGSTDDAEVCIFPRYNWWNNIVRIASVDRDSRTISLAADCSYAIRPGDRYYVQGLLEELDAPGEWYLDQAAGKLYFWPPAPLEGKEVIAPTLRTIVEIGRGTAHLTIRGFDVECCEGTAVALTGTTDCLIAGCVIRNVGDYRGLGVRISGGMRNGVVGCDVSETGSSGIAISGGDRTTLTSADNYAGNNYIHHTGVFYKQGVGIELNGVGNRASHNLIHDCPRMGIIFSGNNLLIEYNHIRHVNLETEDTGVVYTGGRDWISSRGTVIRYNYFHDSLGFGRAREGRWICPYPFAWGVYLDDNAGGVDVIGNIVARCSRAGLHLHNGRDNRIENNVFIDNGLYQAEYSGWTGSSDMWLRHLPTMIRGYESVAGQPAWRDMRNMGIDPRHVVLPNGLIMTGNILSGNIFYYHDPAARLYRFSNVPLDHNEADRNLVWHAGLPILTGQLRGGKAISSNMVPNPGFEEGEAGAVRPGWHWQARPGPECKASGTTDAAVSGSRSLRIDGVKVQGATCNPPWPVVVSDEVPAQPGHSYRLSAKMKAAAAGTKADLMIQSYVQNAYFYSRSTRAALDTDWNDYEVLLRLPAKDEQDYHDEMKAIRARVDLSGAEGTVWVDDVSLVEVESLDQWQSLQACGFDRHSLVADPLFVAPERDDWRLRPESPAFKLGFKPIPIERIGPYDDPMRASWPIVEARGTVPPSTSP